ncbi:hypothetical protein BKA62DRAFT_771613 [Auriculariales sp. MPI-PUGE-AT-0066]|nr:hypothetical protein BKA62DRAFT_771613 [Auriculariales sp. MPI-PUGE-AT-0066]
MHSIPLHILSLIVDELDILDDVKRLSLGNKSLRDAATSRLFRSIRITSSHSQAVVQRMRHFAPRYGHVVRHLTFELTFAPYRGHRGFVRYDSIGAHEILSASLAAVLQLLNNVLMLY